MAFSALRQCKPATTQSPFLSRRLATATRPDPAKSGAFKKFAASLGPAAGPIGVLAATCSVAVMIGIHTAWLQFIRSPSVQVTKTNRENMPEVEIPDATNISGEKFINASFLRKVGHVQERQYGDGGVSGAKSSRQSDNLRTAGVIDKKK